MDLSLSYLRAAAPWLPSTPSTLRRAFDMAGIEVKAIDASVVSVELLANRGDHRSVEGVLREVAAYLHCRDVPGCFSMDVPLVELVERDLSGWALEVPAALAPTFRLADVMLPEGVEGQLPDTYRQLLEHAGMSTASRSVVAATNVVAIELGQPLHSYDADQVVGTVSVALTAGGEKVHLVTEDAPRVLPEGILVVKDEVKVLAVAGVMGTTESSVGSETTHVLVEAAAFDPVLVRRSAQRLGLSTFASQRFERGSDPELCDRSLRRLVAVLQEAGVGARPLGIGGPARTPSARVIPLSSDEVTACLGRQISDKELAEILDRYGFGRTAEGYVVPSWRRHDVLEGVDLIEEVAKALDYNSIPEAVPLKIRGSLPDRAEVARDQINAALVSRGFFEVVGDTFQNDDVLAPVRGFDVEPESRRGAPLRLSNSVDPGNGLLRRSPLPTALQIVRQNVREGITDGSLYEWARVYAPQDCEWPVDEEEVLWFATFSRHAPSRQLFARARRILEDLEDLSRAPVRLEPADTAASSVLHGRQTATVSVDGAVVGVLGTVAAPVTGRLGAAVTMVYGEITGTGLLDALTAERAVPPGPIRSSGAMRRQLSFWLADQMPAGRVIDALTAAAADRPERFDVRIDSTFESSGNRSVTVGVTLDRSQWADRAAASDAVLQVARRAEAHLSPRAALRASDTSNDSKHRAQDE